MLLNIKISVEQDEERSKEWLVNTDPVNFNTSLLIIHFSAIETLICHKEIEFNRVYFLRFRKNYDK